MDASWPAPLRFGRFEIRPGERRLLADGQPVGLGSRAFDLLLALIAHRDDTASKHELLDLVWPGRAVEEANVQVQVSLLRKALGRAAVATIPGRGYRFTLPVAGSAVAWALAADAADGAAGEAGAGCPRIAVLPFVNRSGDPALAQRGDGLTDDLLVDLSKLPGLIVAARPSARRFIDAGGTAQAIAAALHVRYLLEGSVRRMQDALRVTAHLVDALLARQIWAERYDRPLQQRCTGQDELTCRIVAAVSRHLLGHADTLAATRS